jgi:hypothetical protein
MKTNKATIGGTIVGVVVFFAAYFIPQQLFFPTFDKALIKIASELNQSCPIMVDAETRLDNAMAVPKKVFQYHYTLVNMEKEMVDTTEMKKILEPQITNIIRTSPDLKLFREKNVTMKYSYRDKESIHLFTISVTPEQYK